MALGRRTLTGLVALGASVAIAPASFATNAACPATLAFLQATANLQFGGNIGATIETRLFMQKTDGQSGIMGDWAATRMIQIHTFNPPLPNVPGGISLEPFAIPAPGAEQTCTPSWTVPNAQIFVDCVGSTPYRVTDQGILNVAAQTTVGAVNNGVFELDLYFGDPNFPVLTGTPWTADRGAVGLGARAIAESDGNRRWVRLIIGWSATPPDYISQVELQHELGRIADEAGLTYSVTSVQESATGKRQIVADFENLTALPDPILDAEITATVDWGECDASTTRSVRDMLPFGLP